MFPIKFKEQNGTKLRSKPSHVDLPVYVNDKKSISCWKVSLKERISILLFGRVWVYIFCEGKLHPPIGVLGKRTCFRKED